MDAESLIAVAPIVSDAAIMGVATILSVVHIAGKIIDGKAKVKVAANGHDKHQPVYQCPGPPVGTKTSEGLIGVSERLVRVETKLEGVETAVNAQSAQILKLVKHAAASGSGKKDPPSDDAPIT